MRSTLDREANAVYLYIKENSKVHHSKQLVDNKVILDYNDKNEIIGIEILDFIVGMEDITRLDYDDDSDSR